MTHYETLGIAVNATPEEIKSAYRRLARQHHPDHGGNQQLFKQVTDAYAILIDPAARRQYSEDLKKKPVELIHEAAATIVNDYFEKI